MVQSATQIKQVLAESTQLARQQALAAATAISVAGNGRTLGDVAADAKKNPKDFSHQQKLRKATQNEHTGSINISAEGGKVKVVSNGLFDLTNTTLASSEFKAAMKDPDKEIAKYAKEVYSGRFEFDKRIAQYTTAIFQARTTKEIEKAAGKFLPGAISSLTASAKHLNPDAGAEELATRLGILKGLLEATSVKSVITGKYQKMFTDLETKANKYAEGVTEKAANQIIEASKPVADNKLDSPSLPSGRNPMSANAHAPAMAG